MHSQRAMRTWVVRPREWGFEWLDDFLRSHHIGNASHAPTDAKGAEEWMTVLNEVVVRESDSFFSYEPPTDYRLEERHPQLFQRTCVRKRLAQDAKLKAMAAEGKLRPRRFCVLLRRSGHRIPKMIW